MPQFNNRAFGAVVIKSVNSNYNADFSHSPRTLPDGIYYATDKALKYTIRNYIKSGFPSEKVFFFKSISDNMQPRTLAETYEHLFGKYPDLKGKNAEVEARKIVLKSLFSCIDIRLFGAVHAEEKINLSIQGPVQITHGIDQYQQGEVYSENIMSPFRNSNENSTDSTMTTLGIQQRLSEGHYVHGFSVNPQTIASYVALSGGTPLQTEDIDKLKAGMSKGASFYDSTAKAGTENELLLWIQLKEQSLTVLPSFASLIKIREDRTIDLEKIKEILERPHIASQVEKIEISYDPTITKVAGIPTGSIIIDITN